MRKILIFLLIITVSLGTFCIWLISPLSIAEAQKWVFYDRAEKVLFSENPYFQKTKPKDFSLTKKVLVSIEDQRFYDHWGVDFLALGRAFRLNLSSKKVVSGASTITMQLARILFLPNEKHDSWYKIRQIFYAWKLEFHFTKDEILQRYLDRVYLGQGANGFAEASKRYFSKPVHLLSIDEMATLVGTLPRPDTWNGISDFNQSQKRKKSVLLQLKNRAIIDEEEFQFFTKEKTIFHPSESKEIHAPHFVLWAKSKLKDKISSNIPLVQVYTTIDKDQYQDSLKVVRKNIEKRKESKNISNASVVTLEQPSNELRVMLGSVDFFEEAIDGFVNMSTAKRELGSTLKPFLYALALENGFSPTDDVEDKRDSYLTEQGSYSPRNFDPHQEYGRVRFREALAGSYNIAAVNLLDRVGLEKFHNFITTLGLSVHQNPEQMGLSLILGSGESSLLSLTKAYSVFPQKGDLKSVKFFTRVTDRMDNDLLTWKDFQPEKTKVLQNNTAEWITHALSDKSARWKNFSRGNPLELEFETAAKTGTSQDFRDNFVVGFSPQFVTGVWVGNADGTPMHTSSGIEGAGPIWNGIMRILNHENLKFTYNSERRAIQICRFPWEQFPNCAEKITEFLLPAERERVMNKKGVQRLPQIEISFPGEGDIFHPDSSLSIQVRNVENLNAVRYFLDGKVLSSPIIEALSRGKHEISVEIVGERDEIEVFVED